jgi:hypothetical protein
MQAKSITTMHPLEIRARPEQFDPAEFTKAWFDAAHEHFVLLKVRLTAAPPTLSRARERASRRPAPQGYSVYTLSLSGLGVETPVGPICTILESPVRSAPTASLDLSLRVSARATTLSSAIRRRTTSCAPSSRSTCSCSPCSTGPPR